MYFINPARDLHDVVFDAIVDCAAADVARSDHGFASIAGLLAGWRMAGYGVGLFLMGALGLWAESMETLALVVMMVASR